MADIPARWSRSVLHRLQLVCRTDGASYMGNSISVISPDNPHKAIKAILALIVEHAGADFVGVQTAFPEYNLPAYVLFNHRKHHATLALRLDENFGTCAILRRLAECDKKFENRT